MERKAEITLTSQFKNACWTGRATGGVLSTVIGEDIFLYEISGVNLSHSLLYLLHKNLFAQELRV